MAVKREDYILGQIELLRQFVARVIHSRERTGLEEALRLSLHLQEKLFPLPAVEFLALPVDEQIAGLRAGESSATGQGKCLTYARLLHETGRLYEFGGRADLAAGARQLALQVALSAALAEPADAAAATLVHDLLPLVDLTQLHPPVRERLDLFLARPD